jgi:hypothetical protein
MELENLMVEKKLLEGVSGPSLTQGKRREEFIDAIGRLQDLGITWTRLPDPETSSLDEYLDYVRWVSDEIIPHFH